MRDTQLYRQRNGQEYSADAFLYGNCDYTYSGFIFAVGTGGGICA